MFLWSISNFLHHFTFQAQIKKQSKEEETKFLQEISRFNSQFSLLGNSKADFQTQTETTVQELEREVESLHAGQLKTSMMPYNNYLTIKNVFT